MQISTQTLNNTIFKVRAKSATKLVEKFYNTVGMIEGKIPLPSKEFIMAKLSFYLNGMSKQLPSKENPYPTAWTDRRLFMATFKQYDQQPSMIKLMEALTGGAVIQKIAPTQVENGKDMITVDELDYPTLWLGIGYTVLNNAFWLAMAESGNYQQAPTIEQMLCLEEVTQDMRDFVGDEVYAGTDASELLPDSVQKRINRFALYNEYHPLLEEMAGTQTFQDSYNMVKQSHVDMLKNWAEDDKASIAEAEQTLDAGLL